MTDKVSRNLLLGLTMVLFFGFAQGNLAAGGNKQSGKTDSVPTIRYISWTTPSDPTTKPVWDAIAKFAADHASEFKLEHENILGDELKAKIRTDVATNTVPDVFLFWGNPGNASSLLEANVIIPFDEYLKVSKEVRRDMFPPDSLNMTTANGALTTITTGLSHYAWLCNKELFAKYNLKYPTTLDEMIAVGKVFNANGITPFAMGSKGGNPAHEWVAEMLGQLPNCDQDLETINKQYTVNTPNIRRTLETIDTMRQNKLFPADTIAVGDWHQHAAYYNEGKAAMMYILASYQLSNISPEMAAKTVIIPAPKMPGGTRDTTRYCRSGGDMGPMISKAAWNDPKKRDIIVKFVDFLYSKEIMELSLYNAGEIPSRLDINVNPARVKTPLLADIIQWAKGKDSFSNFPTACPKAEVWTSFADGFDELLAGISTPNQVIRNIDAALSKAKE